MDQDQFNVYWESHINLVTLPAELLVHIITFLSLCRDRVKLRYVSRRLRCITEGIPSLWKEFVWPCYDGCEEFSVKEMLKVCGQHFKVLSFPSSRLPSTLIKMLQYCSNVQHLSLPSTKLDSTQVRNTIHHMEFLQTLELKVECNTHLIQLLHTTGQLRELTIFCDSFIGTNIMVLCLFMVWKESQFMPSCFNVVVPEHCNDIENLIKYVTQHIPVGITANFRVYNRSSKVPLNFSPTFPSFQLRLEFDQVTTPFVKLSDFGILG